MKKKSKLSIRQCERVLQYTFKDEKLLRQALTHSSYANENKKLHVQNNERLEFLGDAVLELVVSNYIYQEYPQLPEGELTKLRASIVCEPSLASAARKLNLGQFIYLGNGEERTGGRNRDSILSDTYEAIIGAIYIDGDIHEANRYISESLLNDLHNENNTKVFVDYKTNLQEIIQKNSNTAIEYEIINESGPDHDKVFIAEVRHGDTILGQGKGKSKKDAEQNAAWNAIQQIDQRSSF